MNNFLKDVLEWVWNILYMILEAIGYLVEILVEYWFLTIILAFLLLAWFLKLL